jgi:pimeloyl-ACP methyl ester carboxylesterase
LEKLLIQEHTFDTGQIQLNYAEGGSKGKPIMVLLHGLTGWWQAYKEDFDEYGQAWHLYAVDMRGHGRSGKPQTGYSLPDYAGDLIIFLKEVVGKPVVLVGHSLGALVTLTVAHLAPESVHALIANDPPLLGKDLEVEDSPGAIPWFSFVYETVKDNPSFEQVLERCAAINPQASATELQAIAGQVFGVAPGTVKAALENRVMHGYDLHAGMRTIRCPTLLLYGDIELGAAVSEQDADTFKQLVPQAVIHKFENGTHMLWWEQTETRKKYLQEFLNTV